MAEYEHFLGGLDQIGTDWILVQELLLPPRSVDQTRADAKERSKAYWDRGQSRGNEAPRTGAGTFTATRIQPPPPVPSADDDRHPSTPSDDATASSAVSANGGGESDGRMDVVFTLWLGFVRDRPGSTGGQQAVRRVIDIDGFRVHYVCRDLFGLL
eukprot:jgi/Undpi1/5779/HiC_scaffold_2.g01053.m1